MAPEIARISAHWQDLAAAAFRADDRIVTTELDRLLDAYTHASRHYHDISHIDALLTLSNEHRAELADAVAVDLAIFYHDAVYDPARRDNEAASAALALVCLRTLGLDEISIQKVVLYVEETMHIGGAATENSIPDLDLDHLLDFDLSILAAEPAAYNDYAQAIRREYAIYPDPAYRQGRITVLRRLLEMPRLYRVPALAAVWESRARANLARELALLDPQTDTGR